MDAKEIMEQAALLSEDDQRQLYRAVHAGLIDDGELEVFAELSECEANGNEDTGEPYTWLELIEIIVNFQVMKASLVGAIDGFAKEFGIEAIEFA